MSEAKKPDLENKKAVRLNDGHGTIIYVDRNENSDKAIEKYLSDLKEYPKSSIMNFNKGNLKKNKKS